MIKGVVGTIRWHYYVAAAIHGFTVTPRTRDRRAWSLRATVVLSDAFKMTQRPLVFSASLRGGREWCWPIMSFTIETRNGVPVLLAELGAEVTDVAIRATGARPLDARQR